MLYYMKLDYSKSAQLLERSGKVLAGGVSSEFRKYNYPHALFYTHGKGSRVYDVDGNEYLDFTLSQGPLILGHSHPYVLTVVHGTGPTVCRAAYKGGGAGRKIERSYSFCGINAFLPGWIRGGTDSFKNCQGQNREKEIYSF